MRKLYSKKRGISQVDSIISLSLFILYIVWLFIFLRSISFSNNSSDKELIANEFNNLKWSLNRIMLIVDSKSSDSSPSFIDFPYKELNWTYDTSLLLDSSGREVPFIFDNNYLIFLNNKSQVKYYYIIHSKKEYDRSKIQAFKQIVCNKNFVSTQSIRANFNDGIIRSVSFENNTMINNFEIILNNESFTPVNSSFKNYSFISYHKSIGQNFNSTCYAFGLQNKLSCIVNTEQDVAHQIKLSVSLKSLSGYYSDNSNNGMLNYTEGDNESTYYNCTAYSSDYIKLFDKDKKVQMEFSFPKVMNLSLCGYNGGLQFSASGKFNRSFLYHIIFNKYDENLTRNNKYRRTYRFGVLEKLTGLDIDLITNESVLNNLIGESNKNEGISVFINDKLYSAGDETPAFVNVYAKTFIKEVLLKNGSFEDCKISVRTW